EGSVLALEAMLFRIYDQMFSEHNLLTSGFLGQALRLSEQGRLVEAEAWLIMLQKQDAETLTPSIVLTRLYAHKLRNPAKAYALIESLRRRPNLPPCLIDYLRHRVAEWLAPNSKGDTSLDGIESLLVDRNEVEESRATGDADTNETDIAEL